MRPVIVAGDVLFLVFPRGIGAKWNRDNLILRSSMWTGDGELVSAGFKKFFNWDEQPEIAPIPKDVRGAEIMEKLDGSLLIVSKYKGQLIARTRGTSTIADLDNGFELDFLKDKYPLAFDNKWINNGECSLLFEWTTPENKIVLSYGDEPELRLIGAVFHEDYSLMRQVGLDRVASEISVPRPKTYNFDSIEEMKQTITALEKAEGVCFYYNDGQDIKKDKSPWYLALHRMKSALGNLDEVVDLFFTLELPTYSEFLTYIETQYDFEVMSACRGHASRIYEAQKEIKAITDHMAKFADSVRHLPRPEAARAILKAYGDTNRSGYVFSLLDNKPLKREALKKLLYQVMKN